MTDLERLFRALVQRLAERDPTLLERPVPLHELQTTVIPYRAIRRSVGVESSEDYETLILRLAAGEGGFARAEPAAARSRFIAESRSAHPDLGVLLELGDATLSLSPEEAADALGGEPASAFAPPAPPTSAPPTSAPPRPAPAPPAFAAAPSLAARPSPAPAHRRATPPDTRPTPPSGTAIPQVPAAARSARLTPTDEPDDALPLDAVRSPVPDTRGPSLEAGHCAYCGGTLPTGREVNFCPHCGGSQREPRCPSCHSEIDLGWRHCIACGATLPL